MSVPSELLVPLAKPSKVLPSPALYYFLDLCGWNTTDYRCQFLELENLCVTVFSSCRAAASIVLDSPSVEEAVMNLFLGNWLLLTDSNSLENEKNLENGF